MTCALINPRKDLARVAQQLYVALKSKPCACGKRTGEDGKLVEVECGGCVAKAAYEAVTEASHAD